MMPIKKEVNRLIEKYKTNNPFEIASHKGIIIDYADLGETLGFYFKCSRVKVININNQIDETLQKFVCSHELGHAILHPESNTPFLRKHTFFSIDKIEVEANTFAVELLMTDNDIYHYQDTNLTINDIANIYGIPNEVSHLKEVELEI